jgi:hypothetical protein
VRPIGKKAAPSTASAPIAASIETLLTRPTIALL